MRSAAEALLRRALDDGEVSEADLQDFGHLDYAGVARLLKLDPNLSEAVVAVKLQEVGGSALIEMHPSQFACALSLTKPQQGERLEAFLSALKTVAAGLKKGVQHDTVSADSAAARTCTSKEQEDTASAGAHHDKAAADSGPAAATATKKPTSESGTRTKAVPFQSMKPAIYKGLRAPRVSGLKRPAPVACSTGNTAVAPASISSFTATAAKTAEQAQQHSRELPPKREHQTSSVSVKGGKRKCSHRVGTERKWDTDKPAELPAPQERPRKEQQKQQLRAASGADDQCSKEAEFREWESSMSAVRARFDAELKRQSAYKSMRALISTTGFPEGAGVQNELPGIVRRLGTMGGVSTAFDWKPENPEKITHLICSNKLTRPTVKLYFALVSGAFILNEEFLQEARRKKAWPDPCQFQRADFPPVELREESRWLLRGLSVCIYGPYRPAGLSKQQLLSLAAAAGGSLGDNSSAIWLLEDKEALRRWQARGLWRLQEEAGARPITISAQWLLDCIRFWQVLPREQHVLHLSSPSQANLVGSSVVAGRTKCRNESKTGIPVRRKKEMKLVERLTLPPDTVKATETCVPNSGSPEVHNEETPQETPRHPLQMAATSAESKSTRQENLQQEYVQPHMRAGEYVAKSVDQEPHRASKGIRERVSGRRVKTGKRVRGENTLKKSKGGAVAAGENQSMISEPPVLPKLLDGATSVPGDDDRPVSATLDSTTTAEKHGSVKVTATAGGDDESGMNPSSVLGDWQLSAGRPRLKEQSVAKPVLSTAAAAVALPAEAAPDGFQENYPAGASQIPDAKDFPPLPVEQLAVAELFEPNEENHSASGYDFEIPT